MKTTIPFFTIHEADKFIDLVETKDKVKIIERKYIQYDGGCSAEITIECDAMYLFTLGEAFGKL